MIKVGPIGTYGSEAWDEMGCTELSEIFISYGGERIKYIQFAYIENGKPVLSQPHGRTDNPYFKVVKLNYPSEFLTGLIGKYEVATGYMYSLTFVTNQRTHGPFGYSDKESESSYENKYDLQMGKSRGFGGFFGFCDQFGDLKSIGVYVRPSLPTSGANETAEKELPSTLKDLIL